MKTSIKRSIDCGIHALRAFSLTTLTAILLLRSAPWLRADTGAVNYTDKLAHSRIFAQPLVWVGMNPPSETESRQLWGIFTSVKHLDESFSGLEGFIRSHTNSPWVPSLELNMADRYRQTGYFSLALSHWEAAWQATKAATDARSSQLADSALVDWLQLLSTLGRTDTMKALFDETKDRSFSQDSQWMLLMTRDSYEYMLKHPDASYRCGTFALDAVSKVLTGTNHFREIASLPSPQTGFSLASLEELANSNHLSMVAVERPPGGDLVVPSVVHWKQNHYAAILEKQGNRYRVEDPTFQMGTWLTRAAIDSESSGQFLVPAQLAPAGWRRLAAAESSQIFGKGYFRIIHNPSSPCPGCSCPPGLGSIGGNGPNGGGHGGCAAGGAAAGVAGGGGSPCGGGGGGGGGGGNLVGGAGNASNPGGMPIWTVMGPTLSHWIIDEPLAYQPALGPRISFKIYHDSAEATIPATSENPTANNMGESDWWNSWNSVMNFTPGGMYSGAQVTLYPPGGGSRTYSLNSTTPEYYTKTRLTGTWDTNDNPISLTLVYPSGAQDIYGFIQTDIFGDATGLAFLSQQLDAQGHGTTFAYGETNINNSYDSLVTSVVDGDGKTNIVTYTNFTWVTTNSGVLYTNVLPDLLWQVISPYSNICTLTYGIDLTQINPIVVLSNVTDVAGLSSSFGYGSFSMGTGGVTNLTTPYGTTTFAEQFDGTAPVLAHSLVVSEPEGSHQMYLYVQQPLTNYWSPPQTYTDLSNVVTNRPTEYDIDGNTYDGLDNPDWATPTTDDGMARYNTYYWGRLQFANLSAGFLATGATNWDLTQLTTNDYARGQLRHWLTAGYELIGWTLSMQQEPSPDGTTPGKMTWYDYPDRSPQAQGTTAFPSMVIKVLPDGNNRYEMDEVDQWGNITNVITTYTSGGSVTTRSNQYVFSTNAVDLLLAIGPDGVTNAAYGYNTNHEVTFMTNGIGDVTSYTYDAKWLLTSVASPSGLITTNLYDGDLRLSTTYSYSVTAGVTNYFDTNSYTWTNDLVLSHTDSRGLTTTNTWDPLERLIKVAYPDGTYITNTYSRLDIVQTVDRMGFTNSYGFDGLDRMLAQTNANGAVTRYGYCACGALTSLTNAYGTPVQAVTTFVYDNQGNRTVVGYPDNYSITNHYNSVRQLTNTIDSAGVSVTNWFLNQGLTYASSNYFGQVFNLTFDINDRVATNVDANGVRTVMTYDNLGRVLSRSYPDTGVEKFGYSTNGLIAYTNQLTNVTHYGYDAAQRKTFETNANLEVTQFTYDPAGDLLALKDGKNQTTTWHYDIYGLVSNKLDNDSNIILAYKYDADHRLTNRYSIAKNNTYYYYDKAGNLTNITYPVSPAISLGYDALNRLTNMVDAVGTTYYGYDAAGQLLTEAGPWPDDTVTYTYNNRLRSSLSLSAPNSDPWSQTYEYDGARRLWNTASPAGSFGYTYDSTRKLQVGKLTLPNSAYIANTYDSVARLLSTELENSGNTILNAHTYGYNVGNQRTSQTFLNNNYENYTYDKIGQLTSALGAESGGVTNRLQEQLQYAYDAAHNLNVRTNNALVQTFNVNDLNELSSVTRTGTLTVAGTSTSPATSVTVNGIAANLYADATFAKDGFGVTNGNNTFTAIASDSLGRSSTNSITVYSPTPISFTYDLNGNLLSDGYRTFTYDDENQLTSVVLSNGITAPTLTSNVYDGKMRRRIHKDYVWGSGTSSWIQTVEVHYIYDGNLVIQERDMNNLPTVSYTRGVDLSSSLQGAGGIGGLLARSQFQANTSQLVSRHAYYHCDGKGNITALINSLQLLVAGYEYDPYGNITSLSGPLADANAYRFSSKELDKNSGVIYYLYRFYDPNLQRWLNRDPIAEIGSLNLYESAHNDFVNLIDPLGLVCSGDCPPSKLAKVRAQHTACIKKANADADNAVAAAAKIFNAAIADAKKVEDGADKLAGGLYNDAVKECNKLSDYGDRTGCLLAALNAKQLLTDAAGTAYSAALKTASAGLAGAIAGSKLERQIDYWRCDNDAKKQCPNFVP